MKSASIERIISVESIPEADRIEKINLLGWQTVAQKGLKVNDLVVFVPVDSIVPDIPQFAFMKDRNFRVRKMRFKGSLSQGLAMPISLFENELKGLELIEGLDVTDILNVKHYEKPIPVHLTGIIKGNFPSFIPKTDEERLQNIPNFLKRHLGKRFIITLKYDGTSSTYYLKDNCFGVCGRTLEMKEDEKNTYWKIAKKYGIESFLRKQFELTGNEYAIQGEIYGEGINKNPLGIKGQDFAAFNIFNITNQAYEDVNVHCSAYNIPTVNTLYDIVLDESHTIEWFEQLAKGNDPVFNKMKEGIVVRCHNMSEKDREIGRASFKVINQEYKEE